MALARAHALRTHLAMQLRNREMVEPKNKGNVEITAPMVTAGVAALQTYRVEEDDSALVVAVYSAMALASARGQIATEEEAQ